MEEFSDMSEQSSIVNDGIVHSGAAASTSSLPRPVSALSRKLQRFRPLTPVELQRLRHLRRRVLHVEAGTDLVYEGQSDRHAYVLESGWVRSYKDLANGGRQIINFQIAGDFLGLRSVLLRTADYGFAAITPAIASQLDADELGSLMIDMPHLATSLLWAASRDEAILVEHMASIGRRDAMARVAHFFLELAARLSIIGRLEDGGYDCPLSQRLLADALGMTPIHINRVLRKLRERHLLLFRQSRVTILDLPGLVALAGFDKTYLDLNGTIQDLIPSDGSGSVFAGRDAQGLQASE